MAAVAPSRFTVLAAAAVVVSLLLLLPLHSTAQEETDDELPFSYRSGAGNGPERWGRIRGDWATCSWGKSQSPISLPAAVGGAAATAGRLRRTYRACRASLVNRGHDIMVRFDGDAGSLLIDGVSYRLRQMHWHSPSEHAVDGRRYDMELHMVHQSDAAGAPKYAVVGQLYQIRRHGRDRTLRRLERYIRRVAGKPRGHEVAIHHDVAPWRTVRGSDEFLKYTGSFSTPPCTEGITWTVATNVRHVSRRQVEMLRNAVNDGARMNARPLQPANDRAISLYYNWRRGA